jgi:GTP-binding protein
MQEADVLCFVVDAQVGALDEDDIIGASIFVKLRSQLSLIGNKVDGEREEAEAHCSMES